VVQMHFWTFRDELTISACFNRSFYEASFVSQILEQVTRKVLEGLVMNE
jgi:hypothetical protein